MTRTMRILTFLMLAVVVGTGQAWADALSNPRVKFVYSGEQHGTAFASEANGNGVVTITITPDGDWRCIDGDVTAKVTANTNMAQAPRRTQAEVQIGDAIGVTFEETNVFTLTLPDNAYLNATVTISFSEKLDNVFTVSLDNWTYGEAPKTPQVENNQSGNEPTYTYSNAENGDYSSTVPTQAGPYYVKATVVATADYKECESAPVEFTINPKPVTIATVDVNDKFYDGTTNATLSGTASFVDGMVIEGDEVSISVSGASAVFADHHVGDNKDATVTGLTLAGGSKDNYTLTAQQASAKASIKPAPVTVKADDKSKEWGTADDPELTATVTGMAAGEDLSLISYTIARVKGEFSDSKENSGEYTITPTGEATQGNYAVTYETGKFTIEGKPVTIQDVEGHDVSSVDDAYTITQDQNGVTLTLVVPDETTTPPTVDIPVAVEVNHVVIDRLFESGKAATVYLPLSIKVSKILGGTFHTFLSVDETATPWTVTYSNPLADDATLQAGTPYIFMPDGSNGGKIVVNNGNEKISICTANQHKDKQGQWEFIGTYNPIVWLSDPNAAGYTPERAAEIGSVYGFAAEEKTFDGKDYTVGQFVKVGSGASIDPNRAYLKRNVDQQAPALGGSGRTAVELPSAMRVVILSANSTTGIVEMRNENEEMRNDTWHTLGGRRLQGKPSGRGMYIHNGRKEVIR